MGSIFAAARSSLKADPLLIKINKYWSLAALDAIDKANYLSLTREGPFPSSSHTQNQIHGFDVDKKYGPHNFLAFVQEGWIINTAKPKKTLEKRAHKAKYLRCINKEKYQVYRRDTKSLTTVRISEFVLALTKEKQIDLTKENYGK